MSLDDVSHGLASVGLDAPSTIIGMEVFGIDPAPGNPTTIYTNNGWRERRSGTLKREMAEIEALENVLICWDAPLTGPRSVALGDSSALRQGDLTQREIETFFRKEKNNPWHPPKGISTCGYAGLQHWTISRHMLGLPRVGPYDQTKDLPFQLVTANARPTTGKWVVEVHPALAIWLWCRNEPEFPREPEGWVYKKSVKISSKIWEILANKHLEIFNHEAPPQNDDQLDAAVAYALGKLWITGSPSVAVLGNRDTGAILLPWDAGLWDAFHDFTNG
ncbi:MAG: DUF429 domain-containing protein [Verrucomicrobiae bacterium]|nr:DUF429 domain-containing protein [Verrucomicrobiae bacterium]